MTDRDRTSRTRARASGAVGVVTHHGGALPSPRPGAVRDNRCDHEVHEGRTQTGCRTANAGSRLKPLITQEGTALESQPSSRTGENSPYGMIGGIEEPSASFEARSAPRSYPTDYPNLGRYVAC